MLIVSDLRADTHEDLMSVIEAVAAETAATNAAVAAAATAAAAEAAAASKAAAAHDRRQNRYRGERAARPRRAYALEKPGMLKEPGGGAGQQRVCEHVAALPAAVIAAEMEGHLQRDIRARNGPLLAVEAVGGEHIGWFLGDCQAQDE